MGLSMWSMPFDPSRKSSLISPWTHSVRFRHHLPPRAKPQLTAGGQLLFLNSSASCRSTLTRFRNRLNQLGIPEDRHFVIQASLIEPRQHLVTTFVPTLEKGVSSPQRGARLCICPWLRCSRDVYFLMQACGSCSQLPVTWMLSEARGSLSSTQPDTASPGFRHPPF